MVTAVRPAVAVEMGADRARVLPGDLVMFTIVVTNTGPLEVEGVEVRDVLPEGLEVAGARGKGGEVRRVGAREVRVGYPAVMGVGGVRRVEVGARVR